MIENLTYNGRYCSGSGDAKWLALIDDSLSMMHPTPQLPSLSMVYNPGWDSLREGFIWGNGWWIQNSYGFGYAATPILDEVWFDILQHGLDQFWSRIGDGVRIGTDDGLPASEAGGAYNLQPPDGSLGDAVIDKGIIYKQGDGHFNLYDWFYEATAAGVVMQAQWLLRSHDREKMQKYLPCMLRACECVEKTRAENGLFLVGPSCNLLAPSFGAAYDTESKTFRKSYLTGLSVTYYAALDHFCEVLKYLDSVYLPLYEKRKKQTLDAIPQLLTDEGYLPKSMETDGTRHGVYGAERYGYLEGVCNADAVAFGAVSSSVMRTIYEKIKSVEGIRPAGVLANNWPHLDDTYMNYLNNTAEKDSLGFKSGDWVDGGAWATVEGRAVLAYMKLGEYDDAFKACDVYMKWAQDYRQDAPLSQYGMNTLNSWQMEREHFEFGKDIKEPDDLRPIGVMIDNFAPAAALPRGLFEYIYRSGALIIRPHLPACIGTYIQHEPVYFGGKKLCIAIKNGNEQPAAKLNGSEIIYTGEFVLQFDMLDEINTLLIDMSGGGFDAGENEIIKAEKESFMSTEEMPENLRAVYGECLELYKNAGNMRAFAREVLNSFEAASMRRITAFDKENYRPMSEKKKAAIIALYDESALLMAQGLKNKFL